MTGDRFGPFGYPFGGPGRERPVLAGWILLILAFLVPVLPAIPFLGYLVAVVGASERGESAPRLRGNLRRALVDGVVAAVVCVAYLLVPFVVLVLTVYGAITSAASPDMGFVGALSVYGGSTAVLGLAVLGGYLLPVAVAAYASERSVRAAFSRPLILPVATHAAYFARWTGGAVAFSLTVSVANLATDVPRAGPAIAALALAYGSVLSAHLWGRAVAVARAR